MSAVSPGISVQLDKKQTAAIQAHWDDHAVDGGLLFAQVGTMMGPFRAKRGLIQVVVIDRELRDAIKRVLEEHTAARPRVPVGEAPAEREVGV